MGCCAGQAALTGARSWAAGVGKLPGRGGCCPNARPACSRHQAAGRCRPGHLGCAWLAGHHCDACQMPLTSHTAAICSQHPAVPGPYALAAHGRHTTPSSAVPLLALLIPRCPAGLATGAFVWTLFADEEVVGASSSQPAAKAHPPLSPPPETPLVPIAGRQPGPAWKQGWQQQLQLLPALLLAKAQPLATRKQGAPAPVQSAAQAPEQAAARKPGQAQAAPVYPHRPELPAQSDRLQQQAPQHPQARAAVGSEPGQPAPDASGSRVLWRRHASPPIPSGPAPRPAVSRWQAEPEAELAAWPSAGKQTPMAGARQAGNGPVPVPSPQAGPGPYRASQLVDFWATPRPGAPGSSVLLPSNGSKVSHAFRHTAEQTHGVPQSSGSRRQPGDVGGSMPRQSSGGHAPGEGHGQGKHDVIRSRQPSPMPQGSAPEVQSGAAAGKNGSMHGKLGTPAAHSSHERETGRSQPSSQLWDNFESMDDDTISGVIEAARRAGVRRRMWDS